MRAPQAEGWTRRAFLGGVTLAGTAGLLSLHGPNLAKTKILAKYNTVNQVDRLHGGTKPAHAVRE